MRKKSTTSLPQKNIFLPIIILFSIVSTLTAGYFFYQYQKTKNLLQSPDQQTEDEIIKLVDKVGKLIQLPKDETPSLATVTDKNKLSKQPFFAQTENGDKVLLFTKAKKAILYRPSTNKIIEVGPINPKTIQPVTTEEQSKSTPTVTITSKSKNPPIKVAIYNGSQIAGLAAITERELTNKFPQVNVIKKADAKNNYQETLVVNLSADNKELTQQIAQTVSGKIADSFPEGEATPEADILVILGR